MNNAGFGIFDVPEPGAILPKFDFDNWSEFYALNSWAPAALTSALAPFLAGAAKKGEGRGSVILVTSIADTMWFAASPMTGAFAISNSFDDIYLMPVCRIFSVQDRRGRTYEDPREQARRARRPRQRGCPRLIPHTKQRPVKRSHAVQQTRAGHPDEAQRQRRRHRRRVLVLGDEG